MDLKVSTDGRKTFLRCCGLEAFRIEFRKSESTLRYEELRSEQAKATGAPFRLGDPDILVAICIRCSNEITITDTDSGKVPFTPTYNTRTGQWRSRVPTYDEHIEELREALRKAARGDHW